MWQLAQSTCITSHTTKCESECRQGFRITKRTRAVCVSQPSSIAAVVDAALGSALLLPKAGSVLSVTGVIRENFHYEPIRERAERRLRGLRGQLHPVSGKGLEILELLPRNAPVLDREPLFLVCEQRLLLSARQRCAEHEAAVDGFPQARTPRGRVLRASGMLFVEFADIVTIELPQGGPHGVYTVAQVQEAQELCERQGLGADLVELRVAGRQLLLALGTNTYMGGADLFFLRRKQIKSVQVSQSSRVDDQVLTGKKGLLEADDVGGGGNL